MDKEKKKTKKINNQRVFKSFIEQVHPDGKCGSRSRSRKQSFGRKMSQEKLKNFHSRTDKKRKAKENKIFCEKLKKIKREEKEIQKHCTFKPKLCTLSKKKVKQRSVSDLMDWNKKKIEKKNLAVKKKNKQEIGYGKRKRKMKKSSSCRKILKFKRKNIGVKRDSFINRKIFKTEAENKIKTEKKVRRSDFEKNENIEEIEDKKLAKQARNCQSEVHLETFYETESQIEGDKGLINLQQCLPVKNDDSIEFDLRDEDNISPFSNNLIKSRVSVDLKKKNKKKKILKKKQFEKNRKVVDCRTFEAIGGEILKKNHHKELLNRIIEDRKISRKILKKYKKKKKKQKLKKDKENYSKLNSKKNSRSGSVKSNLSRKSSLRSIKSRGNLTKKTISSNLRKTEKKISSKEFNKWTSSERFDPDVLQDFLEMNQLTSTMNSKIEKEKSRKIPKPRKSSVKRRVPFR